MSEKTETMQLDYLVNRLRESGCRITPQRLAILRHLLESTTHPTAQEVYNALRPDYPTLSLATVYATLRTLKALGDVVELDTGSGEARYDARAPHTHAHFICTRCGKVSDLPNTELIKLVNEIAAQSAQTITGYRLEFFGVCAACQA